MAELKYQHFDDHAAAIRDDIDKIGEQCGLIGLYEEVKNACSKGAAFLFTSQAGFIVLQPYVRAGNKGVRVMVAKAEGVGNIAKYQPIIEEMAHNIGATELEHWTARPGFDKAMPPQGWEKAFTVWRKAL